MVKKEIEEPEEDEEEAEYEDEEEEEEEKPKKKAGRPKKPIKPATDDLDWQYVRQMEFTGIINKETEDIITDEWEWRRRVLSLVEEIAKNTR